MSKVKYIAQGFHEDAGNLLNEYVDKSTVDFTEFASLWSKHHFSLIFMGRPDETEMSEFTNEIFRITLQFLSSPSFYQRVGAVYLLYALYHHQILLPSIKVRVEILYWRVIKNLHTEAVLRKYKHLQYVIEYMYKNGFVYVQSQTLKGPMIGCMQKISKNTEVVSNLKTNYKCDIMQYSVSNNLVNLRDLHTQYLAEKKYVSDLVKVHLNDSSEVYKSLNIELQDLVHPNKSCKVPESLGTRRANLRQKSYNRKVKNRFGMILEDGEDDEVDNNDGSDSDKPFNTPKRKRKVSFRRRVPKHERKVGRPSKKPKKEPVSEPKSDDEMDISHLLKQHKNFYLPPVDKTCKKSRTKRDPYYKTSPKREEEGSSDPDEPV